LGDCFRQVNISEAHIPPWKIQFKTECRQWFKSLSEDDREHLSNIFELLREHGPDLGRPYVDRIKRSSFNQMKEIRTNQGINISVWDLLNVINGLGFNLDIYAEYEDETMKLCFPPGMEVEK